MPTSQITVWAGNGWRVDASPYFRIFNPVTQAQKFDKQGRYINRWLNNTSTIQTTTPIVDLAASRAQALDRYNNIIR
jgi:deoxyribodipyrimidine photo-lyase